MRRAPLRSTLTLAALTLVARASTGDGFVKVIPPGNEPLVSEMLVGAGAGASCALDRAAIERDRIVASYTCAGAAVTVALHHPSDPAASAPAVKTAKFALVAQPGVPRALIDDLASRLRAKEGGWRWVSAEAPGLGAVADAPTAPTKVSAAFTPEQSEAFIAAVKLYREGRMGEAFEGFRALARAVPDHGVLGMVVASLASTAPTFEVASRYAAEADARPDDTLAQFVAGVAAHYAGHRHGRTRAEKSAAYQRTIEYLARTRPKFDFEPRVYVYLGVSHFRLGHQEEAERLIEAAIPLAQNDPDVYYCRAEIFQRVNLPRAIEDIRAYLRMGEALSRQGVPRNEAKHRRVEQMLAHLEAVARGAARPEDLFDPLPPPPTALTAPPAHRVFTSPGSFGAAALFAAIVFTAAWLAAREGRAPRG